MVRLAIFSIALAVAVMEVSLSFVQAFESKIQDKVVGFGSHIQIGNYFSMDEEELPIPLDTVFIDQVDALPEVAAISPYVTKWSIIVSRESKIGILLKGVDSTYDWSFFSSTLIEGQLPDLFTEKPSREILISRQQQQQLGAEVGEKATLYFLDDPPRRRPVTIAGIYETGMEEFDINVVICDLRMLQKVRGWKESEVTGFEINLFTLEDLDATADTVNQMSINYAVYPITRLYPEIFDWLSLQHQNVAFILILMIIVAVINMTSVVLILIIERTRTIGVLKALGMTNFDVQGMFIWNAFFLILFGIIVGNVLGLGLLWTQDQFGWLQVNQESYFIKTVPVAWVWTRFLMVNAGVIVVCTLFMIIPTAIIARITPIKAIRFD